MSEVADSEFGREVGLVHKVIVTGRKAGAGRQFWMALADDVEVFKKVVALVNTEFIRIDDGEFAQIREVRYATAGAWANMLSVSVQLISARIRKAKPQGIKCRTKSGHIANAYSELDMREICADLFGAIPRADEAGFIYKEPGSTSTPDSK